MYTLTRLDNFGTAFFYQAFTFAQFRPRLQVLAPKGKIVAIAASESDKPIGLALAEILPNGKSAEVLSIFVLPMYRRHGVATALLARLEKELFWQGCIKAELIYITGQLTTFALERLLQRCSWTSPLPRRMICKTTTDKIIKASWIHKYYFPHSYEIFPWKEITVKERFAIFQQQKKEPWIPPDLIPTKRDERLESLNSIGLRYRGQVVGWVLTERIKPDTISYNSMFVRQELQKMGRGINLVAHAIQIQVKANIPIGIFALWLTNKPMIRFVKKHMKPYLTSIEESKGSYKLLVDT